MKSIVVVAMLVLVGLVGCIPLSLNSYYKDKDLSFDPALLGLWGDKGKGAEIQINQTGANAYELTDLEADTTVKFGVHLFKLGNQRFLDLCPGSTGAGGGRNDLLDFHLIRGHSLLRVDRLDSVLVTAGLSEKWLKELFSKQPMAVTHVVTDDQVVLTGSTDEIQAFVFRHLGDSAAFESPSEMVRVSKK